MKFCLLHTEQMKKRKPSFQRSHKLEVLRQICNWIPNFLVSRLARETGVADRARTFSPWSHVVAMLYAQLTHAISLNDVCDALRFSAGRSRRFAARCLPVRTRFRTPIKCATPGWPNDFSGRCWSTCRICIPGLRPEDGACLGSNAACKPSTAP